jgi:hypothetical protein
MRTIGHGRRPVEVAYREVARAESGGVLSSLVVPSLELVVNDLLGL